MPGSTAIRLPLRITALFTGVALLAMPAFLAAPASAQALWYVDLEATGASTGQSWADAFPDLQDALAAAQAGDEVWVAEGTYTPTDGTDRTVSFVLASGVGLYGGFDGTETSRDERDWALHETVLSGDIGVPGDSTDNAYHVVVANGVDSTAVLDGFTIERGKASAEIVPDDRGAGFLILGGSPTIRNAAVALNFAVGGGEQIGGGAYIESGSPVFEDVRFEGNGAFGGGLYASGGAPVLRRVTFLRNVTRAAYFYDGSEAVIEDGLFEGNVGGAVRVHGSSPLFRRVTFRANTSTNGDGGGVSITEGAAPLFEDALFENNHAGGNGGAVFAEAAAPAFLRTTFRGNLSGSSGGGALVYFSDALFLGCTFERNRAFGSGAVRFFEAGGAVVNAAFYGNRSTHTDGGGTLTVTGSPGLGGPPLVVANAVLVGNRAVRGGGALYLSGTGASGVRVANVTAMANEAGSVGAALWARDAAGARVENAILWGNGSPGGEQIYVMDEAGPTVRRSLVEGGYAEGTEILDADPRFVRYPDPGPDGAWGTADDDYGDLRLLEGSPAVDYGLAEYLPADVWDLDSDGDTEEPLPVDLDGNARIIGEAPDLGAYEGAVRVASEPSAPNEAFSLLLYPNPVTSTEITATLTLGTAGRVTATLYDVLGRQASSTDYGFLLARSHALEISARGLARGTYLLRVTIEAESRGTIRTLVRTATLL